MKQENRWVVPRDVREGRGLAGEVEVRRWRRVEEVGDELPGERREVVRGKIGWPEHADNRLNPAVGPRGDGCRGHRRWFHWFFESVFVGRHPEHLGEMSSGCLAISTDVFGVEESLPGIELDPADHFLEIVDRRGKGIFRSQSIFRRDRREASLGELEHERPNLELVAVSPSTAVDDDDDGIGPLAFGGHHEIEAQGAFVDSRVDQIRFELGLGILRGRFSRWAEGKQR